MDDLGFLSLSTKADVANYLNGSLRNLSYLLYVLPKERQYKSFAIPKKDGGLRTIYSPASRIKFYQRNLADILVDLYPNKKCVQGYLKERGIRSNALVHSHKRIVINLDLKDFFSSIHFGRVRGMFLSKPFGFNEEVATTLAQICCFNGILPQGAPSSPIVTNFICRRLDNQLQSFAIDNKMTYSRYADDITFSTNLSQIPSKIGRIGQEGYLVISKELRNIIESNDFKINESKTRYSMHNNRQEVTGLIVNEKINVDRRFIRRIRAMLHAWQRYGLHKAALEYFEKYSSKLIPDYPDLAFIKTICGRIGFVGQIKGRDNSVYTSLFQKLKSLDPAVRIALPTNLNSSNNYRATIFCEGKTDSFHLEAALKYFISKGEYCDLNVRFYHYPDEAKNVNNATLLDHCKAYPMRKNTNTEICLFDCDVKSFINNVTENGTLYKRWSDKVYSCVLPKPDHRDFSEVCIEHFYTDEDLKIKDSKGRRLFLSTEFDKNGSITKDNLVLGKRNEAKSPYPKIIDGNIGVHKENGVNVAMTKYDFAKNVSNAIGDFKNVSFEHFRPIFELIRTILSKIEHTNE